MDDTRTQVIELYHVPGFYEPVSVVSHLLGAVIFSILGYRLIRCGRDDWRRRAFLAVYAASCVLLMTMSGVYHMMVAGGTARMIMARLDHSAIFVLIAGTFTPVHGILFRGWGRWGPLALIWTAAIAGIFLKMMYFDNWPEWLGVSLYLLLGWVGALSGTAIALRYGFAFVTPLLWGGIAYSVGALLEFARWPILFPGVVHSHELFHLAVLIGAFYHWSFVSRIAPWPMCGTETPATDNRNARLPQRVSP
jgi:channel protein (hemolysin III family)